MDNRTLNDILSRRSVKRFDNTPVEEEKLKLILKAGLYAPTGKNQKAVKLVAVTDKSMRDRLSQLNADVLGSNSDPFYGAQTVVVVFADRERNTCVEDGSIALGYMLLAAHSLGVGACWVHRAREVHETLEGRALAKMWGIPDNYRGIGNCILGYPDIAVTPDFDRDESRIIYINKKEV